MTKETYQFKVCFLCVWSVHSRHNEKIGKQEAGRAVQVEGTPRIARVRLVIPACLGYPSRVLENSICQTSCVVLEKTIWRCMDSAGIKNP